MNNTLEKGIYEDGDEDENELSYKFWMCRFL